MKNEATLKNNIKENLSIIDNKIIHDIFFNKSLSLKAKGLYAFLYFYPDVYVGNFALLYKELNEDFSIIKEAEEELKKHGLLKIIFKENKIINNYIEHVYDYILSDLNGDMVK